MTSKNPLEAMGKWVTGDETGTDWVSQEPCPEHERVFVWKGNPLGKWYEELRPRIEAERALRMAADPVHSNRPEYYSSGGMQPFDIIDAYHLDFYEGSLLKYLLRWRRKGDGMSDLRKMVHYGQVIIARAERGEYDHVPTLRGDQAYRTANREHVGWETRLLQTYGVPLGWYAETLAKQNGVCAICGRLPAEGKRFPLDHDRSCCDWEASPQKPTCGKCNRELICHPCNVSLGHLERPEWRTKAEAYVSKHTRREIPGQLKLF